MIGRNSWIIYHTWGRYEIKIDPYHRPTPEERRITELELQSFLFAFQRFDEDISPTLLELYITLTDPGRLFLNEQDLRQLQDPGWREHIRERLLWFVQSGWIHVRPLDAELRALLSPTLPLPSLDKPPPPSPPSTDIPTTEFELQVMDQFGRVLEGLPVIFSVGGSRQTVDTNAEGIARLEGQQTGFASVRIEDVHAIQDRLNALGEAPPEAEAPPESADVSVHLFSLSSFPSISLEDKTQHTLVIREPVVRVRLIGLFFDEAKAFLLPSAMNGIQTLVDVYNENPQAKLLVVGHTDREGKVEDNAELSLERAQSIAAYLQDDVDHWLSFYEESTPKKKRWDSLEDRYMLSSLPLGSPDTYLRPGQTLAKAVREFQAEHGLKTDGLAGPQTRRALITDYMALDRTTVPEGSDIVAHGCGEHFPAVATEDDEEEPENRRVEIFVFPRRIEPEPPGEVSEEGSTEYPQWVSQVEKTIDFSPRPIAKFILLGNINFNSNREVLLPIALANQNFQNEKELLSGLDVLITVFAFAEANPNTKIKIVGHTDTAGEVQHNFELSNRRAEGVYFYLSGQKDQWAQHAHKNGEVADGQLILAWISTISAWNCHPGRIDNDLGLKTQTALQLFRENYQLEKGVSLPTSKTLTEADWRAFADIYDAYLESSFDKKSIDNLRGQLNFIDPPILGCGEDWPLEKIGIDNHDSAVNRRVDILFFEANHIPGPDTKQPFGSAIYQRFRLEAVQNDDFKSEGHLVSQVQSGAGGGSFMFAFSSPLFSFGGPGGRVAIEIAKKATKWLARRPGTVSNHIVARHIAKNLAKWVSRSKFRGGIDVKKMVARTVGSWDNFVEQGSKVVFEKQFGRVVGNSEQTIIRVVINRTTGKIITAFPVHEFKVLTSLAAGLIVGTASTRANARLATYFAEVERKEERRKAQEGWVEGVAVFIVENLFLWESTTAREEDLIMVDRVIEEEVINAQQQLELEFGRSLDFAEKNELELSIVMEMEALTQWHLQQD